MTEHLKRVAIITETYAPEINGVAHTLLQLVNGLKNCGIEVLIIRPHQQGTDQDKQHIDEHTITVPGLPLPGYKELSFGLPMRSRISSALTEFAPQAIYVATEGPLGLAACSAARRLNVPVVSGFHTNFHQYGKHYHLGLLENLGYRYLRWFHNRTAATLVPTINQANELTQHLFERVHVMARGVDSELFSPARRKEELRRQWGVTDQDLVLIYVGRIAAEKNLQLALKTYQSLRQQDPRIKLVLVGDGPAREGIQAAHPEVIWAGMQRGIALAEHYASGDIFLFPSLTDTFGNVVTEALASGLALVSFDYAAAQEHTKHEVSAMLSEFGDENAYIRSALALLDRPNLLRHIRQAGRQIALTISWARIIEEFIQHLTDAQTIDYSKSINSNTTHSKAIHKKLKNSQPNSNNPTTQKQKKFAQRGI
ncbi:MAG: glycosyltransferase family 1 protein [Oleibacter sp.]|nr:glycosyltransferase family 1 protein [Thalassolituus sp.]